MKFSQVSINAAPATADYVMGVTAGNVDMRIAIGQLATLIAANIPDGSVKYADLDVTTFPKVVEDTNPGNIGGTRNYKINQDGTRECYGITVPYSIGSGGGASGNMGVTFPVGFFTTIKSVQITISSLTGDARQFAYLPADPTTTGMTLTAYYIGSGAAVGGKVHWRVIGT